MIETPLKLYQAPLQGFTDYTFRRVFADCFGGIDKYFIPYLSYGKGREIKKSQLREVLPENNPMRMTVPQVLFSDGTELLELTAILVDHGYLEINLNLGCPYPMATNKGRGSAWLQKSEELSAVLEQLFTRFPETKFSVKMRAGMTNKIDCQQIFGILNNFSLEEVIFHPRTADQMYEGKADKQLFASALPLTKHPLVYNGDIFSQTDFEQIRSILPEQNHFMIGRGLLTYPLLARQLHGEIHEKNESREKLRHFHDMLLEEYATKLDGAGHLLIKMNQFWGYFSHSFDNPHKAMKLIKKSGNLVKYNAAVAEIFRNY